MTSKDKLTLTWMTIAMVVVTVFVIFSTGASIETIGKTLITDVEKVFIASLVSVVASGVIMSLFYRGQMDSSRTTNFYLVSSPEEEVIFRFNTVLVANALQLQLQEVVIIAVIQAAVFAILHPKNFIKFFILALLWFATTYWAGIVPAMLGHIVANLTHRYKARKAHGWYDEE